MVRVRSVLDDKPVRGGARSENLDRAVVEAFGAEWSRFDQSGVPADELEKTFGDYFSIFPWAQMPEHAVGFDLGCGSGRWAQFVAPRVSELHCIDASESAIAVARRKLRDHDNCRFHLASVDCLPLSDASMDFGYALGVLHHVPDTAGAIRACVEKLRPGAPLLLYLYYAFDNRPAWFKALWALSDGLRRVISIMPGRVKYAATQSCAALVYWPLARLARVCERFGVDVADFPLAEYRHKSYYTMRTDALDRFGTRLEKRFSRQEIAALMAAAGLVKLRFRDAPPYWCVLGFREQ